VSVLHRHASGNWHEDARAANEQAVLDGCRILSHFEVEHGGVWLRLWVLTEADRQRTFVMFPEESAYRASDLEEDPEPHLYGPPPED